MKALRLAEDENGNRQGGILCQQEQKKEPAPTDIGTSSKNLLQDILYQNNKLMSTPKNKNILHGRGNV